VVDLTLIIATYNRALWLSQTLNDFLQLDTGGLSWELILVDNCSTDDTEAVTSRYGGRLPLRYLFGPIPGKNHALNLALERARGDVVVFADDDISPDPCWLKEILAACDRWPDCSVFGGRVIPVFPPGTPRFLRESDFSDYVFAIHDLPQQEGSYPPEGTPVGPNCWVRRQLFDAGWRYDPTIGPNGRGRISGSELEFFTRLRAAGFGFVYVPAALVHHRIQPYQTTIRYLLKRSYASGRGFMRIEGPPPGAKKWLGVPRYLFRQLLGSIARALVNGVLLQRKTAFEDLMHASLFLGCIHEARHVHGGMGVATPEVQ
jgi:glycosyltransferase involved in cell wall biosynthesis